MLTIEPSPLRQIIFGIFVTLSKCPGSEILIAVKISLNFPPTSFCNSIYSKQKSLVLLLYKISKTYSVVIWYADQFILFLHNLIFLQLIEYFAMKFRPLETRIVGCLTLKSVCKTRFPHILIFLPLLNVFLYEIQAATDDHEGMFWF